MRLDIYIQYSATEVVLLFKLGGNEVFHSTIILLLFPNPDFVPD
jgi:hypothetical protein